MYIKMSTETKKLPVNETNLSKLAINESIKTKSNYLRGTIIEGLADRATGSMSEDDQQLIKFHGVYQQDDRDLRVERLQQKLEPAYSFMIRARVPGGVSTAQQWLDFDALASQYGAENFRLTTRQAFQLHGVIKQSLKQTIADINASLLDTIAACGDVNRNVMCSIAPHLGKVYHEVLEVATSISTHLTPHTRAYHEIWLDGKKLESGVEEAEPIYGKTYLPRKFKIGVAIPPYNDVDVFSQDIGFIAQIESGVLLGFDISIGGGMGATHGDQNTYPRAGSIIGFCLPNQVVAVAEEIVKIQRDYGNRINRKRARFKYTIDDLGLDFITETLAERLGYALQPAKLVEFISTGDNFGWHQDPDGLWSLALFIPQGRIVDTGDLKLRTALREIASIHQGTMIITPNQNLVIAEIAGSNRSKIESILKEASLVSLNNESGVRKRAIACVAFPTCGLAMAEAERYLPKFVEKVQEILLDLALEEQEISIRIRGCPNGCARPFLAEIGLVGKSVGRYNYYIGGSITGDRLNRLYMENVDEVQIISSLRDILTDYAKNRLPQEGFGDFTIRKNYVAEVLEGRLFHAS